MSTSSLSSIPSLLISTSSSSGNSTSSSPTSKQKYIPISFFLYVFLSTYKIKIFVNIFLVALKKEGLLAVNLNRSVHQIQIVNKNQAVNRNRAVNQNRVVNQNRAVNQKRVHHHNHRRQDLWEAVAHLLNRLQNYL